MVQTQSSSGVIGLQFVNTLVCCISLGQIAPARGMRLNGLAVECARTGQVLRGDVPHPNTKIKWSQDSNPGVLSALAVPVSYDGVPVGVLELLSEYADFFASVPHMFDTCLQKLCLVEDSHRRTPQRALATLPYAHEALPTEQERAAETFNSGTQPKAPVVGAVASRLADFRKILQKNSGAGTWNDMMEDLAGYLRTDLPGNETETYELRAKDQH